MPEATWEKRSRAGKKSQGQEARGAAQEVDHVTAERKAREEAAQEARALAATERKAAEQKKGAGRAGPGPPPPAHPSGSGSPAGRGRRSCNSGGESRRLWRACGEVGRELIKRLMNSGKENFSGISQ